MPSQILHTLFGEDVIDEIYRSISPRFGLVADKALEKIRRDYRAAFALGCQGPDIFYHSQGRRPVGLEYGTLLHRRGAGAFTAGLLKMGLPDPPPDEEDIRQGRREKGINALGAYALGFMTHAVLDRHAHPYIVYKSGWVSPAKPETLRYARFHAFLERIIDVLMLQKLRGMEAASWDQEAILAATCERPPLGLKELLAKALVLAFPERAGKDEKLARRIDNTFLDCAGFYLFTDPRRTSMAVCRASPQNRSPAAGGEGEGEEDPTLSAGALALVYPERLPDNIDFLNMEKAPWFYPAGESGANFRSFPEIYAEAIAAAAAAITPVIAAYLATGIFPIREAAQAIGNGGLSIQDAEGKPIAPTRSMPLPLDRVLEGQGEMRGIN
ncbi:MAG: zinc dependent phospholipase C family protein [Treponema sp.]|jgi:hypothetical protein|nr:zinc dependent phospholipase C family protein [Treponema sp.]